MAKPVIKWTGSKRSQAKEIVSLMPEQYNRYFEPFIGGGSVLYSLDENHRENAVCSDICEPLMYIWQIIKNYPTMLYESYKYHWEKFQQDENYYYEVRSNFNKTKDPFDFFFLTRTCINGKIRFNKKGESSYTQWHTSRNNEKYYSGLV